MSYPENWEEIAKSLKDKWHWRCERCGRAHNPGKGYALTVHHLDKNKSNCEEYNLAVLCQRCHLHIQAKINTPQMFFPFLKISAWFLPHLEGFIESQKKPK